MIAARAKQLVEDIAETERLSRRLEQLQGLVTRRDALWRLHQGLQPIVASWHTLNELTIPAGDPPASTRLASDRVQQMRRDIGEAASVVIDGTRYGALSSAVERATSNLRLSLLQAWGAYVDKKLPVVNRQVLEVLKKIRDFRAAVGRIETLLVELESARSNLPLTADQVAAFDSGVQQVGAAWQSLGGDSVPGEVIEFLRQAGATGAAVDLLTESVAVWLRAHGIWDSFRVTLVREAPTPGRL